MKHTIIFLLLSICISACINTPESRLQVKGEQVIARTSLGGKMIYDTISAHIPAFSFINQYGDTVDTTTVHGQIYVAEFFFTHCPSICPKMAAEMHRVYDTYGATGQILILSHSIDPQRDTMATLRNYAAKLHITGKNWLFLTGNRDSIYAIADHYLAFAKEDKDAPGGFIHDGNFILIDRQRRIRGYYDGTTDQGTDKLIADIKTLLGEK